MHQNYIFFYPSQFPLTNFSPAQLGLDMQKNVFGRSDAGERKRRHIQKEKALQFLEFHFVPASVAPGLNGMGTHSIHLFFLGNPVALDASDECLRLQRWLAWKVAITEIFFFCILGHTAAHFGVTVSCPHPRSGWGSVSSFQAVAAPCHNGLQLAHSAEIARFRSGFSSSYLKVVRSEND